MVTLSIITLVIVYDFLILTTMASVTILESVTVMESVTKLWIVFLGSATIIA